ncbi:unnamed protein product, partial [Brassica rapa subsp. narinosa]
MHSFTDFEANCDLRGYLHGEFSPDPINLLLLANSHYNSVSVVDVVGHLSLVDGHPLHPRPVLCITSSKVHCLIFSYKEISDAMCGFDRILQISEGGFGSVYKAIINDPTATGGNSHSVPLAFLIKGHKQWLDLVIGRRYCSEDTKSFLIWKQRLEIMLRAAQGLAYLHELQRVPEETTMHLGVRRTRHHKNHIDVNIFGIVTYMIIAGLRTLK